MLTLRAAARTAFRRGYGLAGLIFLLSQALALPGAANEIRVALVVGAGTYLHAPHLPNTLSDAREVAAKLKHLGFDVETVTDPDRSQFESAVRRFGQHARGADAALFYYAGHALELEGRNWLVPVQADLQSDRDLRFEALDLDAVVEQIEGQARVSILILDACRNNPFKRIIGPDSRGAEIGGGLAPQRAATGTLIVYATALGEVAADGNGPHSPFTAALLRHMESPGVEVRQLIAEVRHDVRQVTYGKQTPWESSALEGEFFLDPAPAQAPAASTAPAPASGGRDADVVFWDSVKDSHDPVDIQLYLSRYPNGQFTPLAKSRLAQLSHKAVATVYQTQPAQGGAGSTAVASLGSPPLSASPPSGAPTTLRTPPAPGGTAAPSSTGGATAPSSTGGATAPSSPGALYQGAYFCGRRVARVTLKVLPQAGEPRRRAMFSFGPEPTSPDVPRGTFIVEGAIDTRGGALSLTPVKWVSQPAGYNWLGLSGRSDDGGKTFSGRIIDNAGCSIFTLRRIADNTAAK